MFLNGKKHPKQYKKNKTKEMKKTVKLISKNKLK